MKKTKEYLGIALTTLALPILSHTTGLSKMVAETEIAQERRAHLEASSNSLNNYELHYQAHKNNYHRSAELRFTGIMALIGLTGAINFFNIKRKIEEL